MCPARGRGVDCETVIQVALVLLFIVLAGLVWGPRLDVFALGG